jgi:hypothetical protein
MGADPGAPADLIWVGVLFFVCHRAHEQLLKLASLFDFYDFEPPKTKKLPLSG